MLFSDEVTFNNNESDDRHNCHYYPLDYINSLSEKCVKNSEDDSRNQLSLLTFWRTIINVNNDGVELLRKLEHNVGTYYKNGHGKATRYTNITSKVTSIYWMTSYPSVRQPFYNSLVIIYFHGASIVYWKSRYYLSETWKNTISLLRFPRWDLEWLWNFKVNETSYTSKDRDGLRF